MIRSLAGLAAANVLILVLGTGVLLLFGTWARTTPLARVGLALFAGLAAFFALVPPLLYVGLPPSPPVVGVAALVVIGAGLTVDRRRGPSSRDPGGAGIVVAAVAAVPLLLLAVRAAVKPLWVGDAFLNWTLKAKMLYGHGSVVALDDRFFTGGEYRFSHLEYPLGFPALEAFLFHAMGGMDTRVLHVQFVVFLAAFAAAVWALLRPCVDGLLLGAGLLLVLMAPAAHRHLLSGYADFELAGFVVAAAIALGLWVHGDGRDRLPLAALFAAAALATKVEAILFVPVLFGVAGAAVVAAGDRRRGRLVAAGFAAAATAVPWQLYAATRGLHNPAFTLSPETVAGRVADLPEILTSLIDAVVRTDWFLAVPLAVGASAVLLVRGPRRLAGAYLVTLLALLAVSALVYLTTVPGRDLTSLLNQSAARVAGTVNLFSAVLLPLLLARALAPRPGANHAGRSAVDRDPVVSAPGQGA